ncbi:hypothetical protein NLU13_4831 [Sarocladium strictum]|uniref:Hamartin n=1 Tax=Sarocladium strictum TaxID=5046 RepID=A0AA39GL09_SARSR|nr:hypothetical protein NLU13_4831 [Sarocladium strictum]
MSSSTSLKDLTKAINTFVTDPVLPLPDSLVDVIAGYLDRHQKYDDSASDRLQEELFTIFDKYVKGNPNSYAAWFGIIRRLLPVLQTQERLLQWFDACQGYIDKAPVDKSMITETVAGLMDVVLLAENYQEASDGEGAPNPIIHRLFSLWMDRFYPASVEGQPNAQHNEKLVREGLIQFGKRRPKEFFSSLDHYLVKKQYRKAALRFFCDYVQSRPPHLHQILDVPLFSHLLSCLQLDTSTTAISAALIALIMLLPHMPSSVVPHLPTLFNIYARVLFWSRERSTLAEATSPHEHYSKWEVCAYDPKIEDLNISHLDSYYTVLYGLYPINFMDYIRKPQRYLRHANIPDAEDIEVQPTEIRHLSEAYRRCHVLHPNFYTLTIDSEKTDFGRWIKSEAAEVAAECMSLRITATDVYRFDASQGSAGFNEPQQIPEVDNDGADPALLSSSLVLDSRLAHSTSADSGSSHKGFPALQRPDSLQSRASDVDSGDTRKRPSISHSPTLSAHLVASASHTHLQDMLLSNKAIKSGLSQSLANDSVPSLSLSHHEEKPVGMPIPSTRTPESSTTLVELNARVSQLQRQILLLQNDLTFERYQKQQHMAHIGDLRRRLVSEATSEAETQNLILTNRGFKSRYEEAKKAEMQVRREFEKGRTMANNREGDLYNKLKKMREEVKRMEGELEISRKELSELKTDNEKLRKMVLAAEVRESKWQEHKLANEMHVKELERLKMEVSRLSLVEREAQGQEQATQEALTAAAASDSRAEALRLELQAEKQAMERSRKEFQAQIESMQKKIMDNLERGSHRNGKADQSSPEVQNMLAASREKQAELKKQYDLLSRKYTALQSSLLDMQSAHISNPTKIDSTTGVASPDSADANLSMSPTSMTARRMQRILSETDMSGTSSEHTTRTAELAGTASSHADTSIEGSSENHPTSSEQRYFGRGGVQNRSRGKEAKEGSMKPSKARDESPAGSMKREKRSGLRGIRGLV